MMLFRKIATIFFATSVLLTPATADVSYDTRIDDSLGRVFFVVIGGQIASEDYDDLIAAKDQAAAADLRLMLLASEGGDLNAAMKMGRYLRSMDFDAVVVPNAVCYSACVFLLAAGVDKKVQGIVGIHRPYFSTGVSGSVSEAIKAAKADAESFLDEMNIPKKLAEDMFSIEPASMRLLTEQDLRDYRLNTKDYVAQESDTVNMAETAGVTREVYEAFRKDLNYSCQIFMGRPDQLKICMNEVAMRHNIPMPPEIQK